jgi:hypothetical protein
MQHHPHNIFFSSWPTKIIQTSVFFGQNFTKFKLEKYDFDMYKGFFVKKITQIRQIYKK